MIVLYNSCQRKMKLSITWISVLVHLTHSQGNQQTGHRPLVTFGSLKEWDIKLDYNFSSIGYLETDTFLPGHYVIADDHVLLSISPNGTVTNIAGLNGHPNQSFGIGEEARFYSIGQFTQYNVSNIAVPDTFNHCVKRVDRRTRQVQAMIGQCGKYKPSERPETAKDAAEVSLFFPACIIYDASKQYFYISVTGLDTIYRLDQKTNLVSNLLSAAERSKLSSPMQMVFHSNRTTIYVLFNFGLSEINLTNMPIKVQTITGESGLKTKERQIELVTNGNTNLATAKFNEFTGLGWLIQDQVLVCSEAQGSNALRVINLVDKTVETICTGNDTSQKKSVLGAVGMCSLVLPNTIFVNNQTIFTSAKETLEGNNQRYTVLQLNFSAPTCRRPQITQQTRLSPDQENYDHLSELAYSCSPGYGLNTAYRTQRCVRSNSSSEGQWAEPTPQCLRGMIENVYPLSGQKAGGTLVRIHGIVPDDLQVFLRSAKSFNQSVDRLSSTDGTFTFRMPPSDERTIEILAHVSNNTVVYNFTYTENPVVKNTDRTSTIMSGGLPITFFGDSLSSAAEFKLLISMNNSQYGPCNNTREGTVTCLTPNLAGLVTLSADVPDLLKASLIGDDVPVQGAHKLLVSVWTDPVINPSNKTLVVNPGESITLAGAALDLAAELSDYSVLIDDLGRCNPTSLTEREITCLPSTDLKFIEDHPYNLLAVVGTLNLEAGQVMFRFSDSRPLTPGRISDLAIGLIVAGCLVALVIIFLSAAFIHRRRSRINSLPGQLTVMRVSHSIEADGLYTSISMELKVKVNLIRLNSSDLVWNPNTQPIGTGNFGRIYRGQLNTQGVGGISQKTVAIKTLKDSQDINSEVIEDFLKEATMMVDYKHPNVLRAIGVVWEQGDRPRVVLPYMINGDLRSFIMQQHLMFTLGDLLHFGMQVACGMEYLAANKFVHRDLAARNCLVNENYIVKIADFGLSRDIYEKDYYRVIDHNRPLPIKWMALESIREGVYDEKTDVWSFGVLLWELCTRGSVPYDGIESNNMRSFLETGNRLFKPTAVDEIVYELMSRCWLEDSVSRPTFSEIHLFMSSGLSLESHSLTLDYKNHKYSYVLEYTKHIPRDYSTVTDYSEDDDALTVGETITGSGKVIRGLDSLLNLEREENLNDYKSYQKLETC